MKPDHHSHHYSPSIALGMRLKHWRVSQNLNIALAANQLGVSTATWGHWETGEHLPAGGMLLSIQSLTRMPLHVLFCPHLDNCPRAKTDTSHYLTSPAASVPPHLPPRHLPLPDHQ